MKRRLATLGAAAALFSATQAYAGSSAELFVEQAYAPWINHALKRISDTDLMSEEFMQLWRADDDAAAKVNELGLIDGNLICSCQDGQMSDVHILVRDINATRATAHVTFSIDGMARDQYLLLKNEHGRWTIDDILDHGKSLRARLREDARMRLKHAARPAM